MRTNLNKNNGYFVARTVVILVFSFVLFIRATPVRAGKCPSPGANKGFIQVKIHQIGIEPNSSQAVVLLADLIEERSLLIWIGAYEANAIHSEMQGIEHPRPLTHDLLEKVIWETEAKIQCVIITRVKDMAFIASLQMEIDGSPREIDARPSDSMVMALKFKAPIFVSEEVFKTLSVPLKTQAKVEEKYGLTAQDLTPSLAQAFSYGSVQGVLVSDVRKDSSAEKDGFKRGDIIIEIAGQSIEDVTSLKDFLIHSDHPVPVRIFRKAAVIQLTMNPG